MVKITDDKDHFIIEVMGLHKLWSFKNRIKIPKENIVRVHNDVKKLPVLFKGLRMPGTHVPFFITAGTYYKGGKKNFWDVVKERNAIVIELKNEKYNNLIVEVENPEEALSLLKTE